MSQPTVTIIIPTYNRPHLLKQAVKSALNQTFEDTEILVVDDASPKPIQLPEYPQVRVVRSPQNQGIAGARNMGAKLASGRWLTFLDDDDELFPTALETSLGMLNQTDLPSPVAVLSGLEVVSSEGKVLQTRIPPTLPKGSHFVLEDIPKHQSFLSKQTLLIERELLLALGGYDESFRSREHTEFFLRLNPVCSILGVPVVTYRQTAHPEARLSRTSHLRQKDFYRLLNKHKPLLLNHPKGFAKILYAHAQRSYELGQIYAALHSFFWALKVHPRHTLGFLRWELQQLLKAQPKLQG